MNDKAWTTWAVVIGCAAGGLAGLAHAEQSGNAKPTPPAAAQSKAGSRPRAQTETVMQVGDLAACRPSTQLTGAVQRLVSFADPNSDGKITRTEATTAANFLVGGFFFRADENEDGIVTPKEGLQARKDFMHQQPVAARLLRAAKDSGAASPFKRVADLLDIDYSKPVSAAEAHQAARSAVNDIFKTADTNHDGAVTFEEARAASWRGAQAVGDSMFSTIDTDKSGYVTLDEFQKSLQEPASIAFKMADDNGDGRLTKQEASSALTQVVSHIGLRAPNPGS